jgi:hypothetical protein
MVRTFRRILAGLVAGVVTITALAQSPASVINSTGGSIEGTVANDRTGLPLKRAHVVLRPAKAGANPIAVETDDRGAFAIRDVEAGRYSLSATRDGYLASSICQMGTVRLPQTFAIGPKESITGLMFRLRPFAVMAGRISHDDGEPAIGNRVEAYREYRNRLRHGYLLAASATTNDRGEYRMFGLQPGSYIVAAISDDPQPANEQTRDALRATTTFYLNSTKLSEASPVRLEYGQEVGGIDIFLERVRKVKIHGRMISGVTGAPIAATIALQRVDAHNTASIAVTVPAMFDRDNRFEIRDVTPGSYIIWAEGSDGGGKTMSGHVPLTVTESDIDTLDLTIVGEHPGIGVLVVDGGVTLAEPVTLRFEPRNERAKIIDAREEGGNYQFPLMGDEVYDPFVANLPNDFYLSAVLVNGADAMPFGIPGSAASLSRPLELVLDSRGGRVSGRVLGSDDSLWSRASIALIPDPPAGRVQSYRESAADENGLFQFRGVAPGKYVLVAWLDDLPCDYYDPDAILSCRAAGASVDVRQAGEQSIELKMKVPRKR